MDNQPESTIKIEVIQAGVNPERAQQGFPPIALERTSVTGLAHKDGVISMARGMPDSATSGWFICINDQPSLDFGGKRNPDGQGFAAFGRVVSGMDVVRKIQTAPSSATRTTNAEAQKLTPPIKILKAARAGGWHAAVDSSRAWSWPSRGATCQISGSACRCSADDRFAGAPPRLESRTRSREFVLPERRRRRSRLRPFDGNQRPLDRPREASPISTTTA